MKKLLVLASAAIAAGVIAKRFMKPPHDAVRPASREPSEEVPALHIDSPVRTSGDVLGLLAAFDEHQVRCAELALRQEVDEATQTMARKLREEHLNRLEELRAEIERRESEPAESVMVSEFAAHCMARYQALDSNGTDDFSASYLASVIEEHEDMIELAGGAMNEAASDMTTVDILRNARASLASHLSELEMMYAAV